MDALSAIGYFAQLYHIPPEKIQPFIFASYHHFLPNDSFVYPQTIKVPSSAFLAIIYAMNLPGVMTIPLDSSRFDKQEYSYLARERYEVVYPAVRDFKWDMINIYIDYTGDTLSLVQYLTGLEKMAVSGVFFLR